MADLDYAALVFAGILPDRPDRLVEAMRWLEPEHFANPTYQKLWKLLVKFYEMGSGLPTRRFLDDFASKLDAASGVLLGEVFDAAVASPVADFEVKAAIHMLRDIRSDYLTGEALTRGVEILTRGGEVNGREVDPGFKTAWEFVNSEFSRIEQLGSLDAAPEGDVMIEPAEGLADYAERKKQAANPIGTGVHTGIPHVDNQLAGGIQPGDFMLVVGYTGAGKSQFATQTAWNVVVNQAKNVFYATSETTRELTRRRIYARHSRLPQFGLAAGIDSKKLRMGALDATEELVLQHVVEDLAEGARTGRYGHLYLAQVPPGAQWSYVAAATRRVNMLFKIDLIVMDYLALLRPDRRREKAVEEWADMLKGVKVFATSFHDGKGVAVMSPWAVKQEAYKSAQEMRRYTLASLADASEAEKTPDQILYLLGLPDEKDRVHAGFLKNRDGDVGLEFELKVDFRSTYLGDEGVGVTAQGLEDENANIPEF